jgi:hypothetical protein
VIHTKVQALKVRNVACNVEREDLPLAVVGQFVAASETLHDKTRLRGAISLPNNVVISRDGSSAQGQSEEAALLLVRERSNAPQLPHEDVVFGVQCSGFGHEMLLAARREHRSLSADGASEGMPTMTYVNMD